MIGINFRGYVKLRTRILSTSQSTVDLAKMVTQFNFGVPYRKWLCFS